MSKTFPRTQTSTAIHVTVVRSLRNVPSPFSRNWKYTRSMSKWRLKVGSKNSISSPILLTCRLNISNKSADPEPVWFLLQPFPASLRDQREDWWRKNVYKMTLKGQNSTLEIRSTLLNHIAKLCTLHRFLCSHNSVFIVWLSKHSLWTFLR